MSVFAVTGFLVLWALWIRRHTWGCKWERASTISMALMALCGVLLLPCIGTGLDGFLYPVTRVYNLHFFLANTSFLAGMCAIVYTAVSRITPDRYFMHWFKRHIETPSAFGVAIMLLLFARSPVSSKPHPDFLTMQIPGPYFAAYWLVFCGLALYLLYHAVRAFIDLWFNKESRRTVNVYLAGSALLAAGESTHIYIAITRPPATSPLGEVAIVFCSTGVALFAIAASRSWVNRVRSFYGHGWNGDDWPQISEDKEESV